MTDSAVAELYFIAAMMILTLILSVAATYIFFRQYNLEKKNKDKINEQAQKSSEQARSQVKELEKGEYVEK
jgi:Na+/melibiose symporter-like transporter